MADIVMVAVALVMFTMATVGFFVSIDWVWSTYQRGKARQ